MRSAVTVSLVKEARGGPFVFWHDLPGAFQKTAELGFDGIEIFPPAPEAIAESIIRPLMERNKLKVASIGTGAGWVIHKLSLTSPDEAVRERATAFIRSIIDAAGKLGAPTVIGSMQGRWGESVDADQAVHYLETALNDLGEHAKQYNVPLIYEPLNRYETNIVNTLSQGVSLLQNLKTRNVKLLADLFHLNIEEIDIAAAILHAAGDIGHVHLADSNRRAAGNGHIPFEPIAKALAQINFGGYVSAECLPYPDPDGAAKTTIEAFKKWFAPLPAAGPH